MRDLRRRLVWECRAAVLAQPPRRVLGVAADVDDRYGIEANDRRVRRRLAWRRAVGPHVGRGRVELRRYHIALEPGECILNTRRRPRRPPDRRVHRSNRGRSSVSSVPKPTSTERKDESMSDNRGVAYMEPAKVEIHDIRLPHIRAAGWARGQSSECRTEASRADCSQRRPAKGSNHSTPRPGQDRRPRFPRGPVEPRASTSACSTASRDTSASRGSDSWRPGRPKWNSAAAGAHRLTDAQVIRLASCERAAVRRSVRAITVIGSPTSSFRAVRGLGRRERRLRRRLGAVSAHSNSPRAYQSLASCTPGSAKK
jgi:hypothetical protein